MNLCFTIPKYPPDPGGLATAGQRLAQNVAAAGHRVRVVAPDGRLSPGEMKRTQPAPLLTEIRFGTRKRLDDGGVDWFEVLTRLHGEEPFDLLHGYYLAASGFVTVYAGRYLGVPTMVSARGNDLERTVFNPQHTGPITWALQNANRVTAVSSDLARKALALAPGCPVDVIQNSVDGAHFRPLPREAALHAQLKWPADVPLIGFVGEARQKKGLGVLLVALAELVATSPRAPRLLLIGGVRKSDKPLLTVFKAQNPQARVRVIPYVARAQLPAWYNLVDLLWLPSMRDGLPNALLEGMACGRATIASAVGGIPTVIEHDKNGILVPPGDVGALVTATRRLLAEPDRRRLLGQAARETILAHHPPQRELDTYLAAYNELLAAGASP